jgi:hypothetical protein
MQHEHDQSSQTAGFIFVCHIRACGMCTIKARRFFLNQGLTNAEIQDFFNNGMPIDQFEQLFGHDAMAQQVIERAKRNGE